MTQVTGIVLAGGGSTRFGSDKLAAEVGGEPLLRRAVSRVAEVSEDVVVVLAAGGTAPSLPDTLRVRFAHDAEPDQGPLQGVLAGLTAAPPGTAVIAGGDMPYLSVAVLHELVRLVEDASGAAVLQDTTARAGYRPLPMAVAVARATLVVRSLLGTGKRSLHDLAEALHPAQVPESTWALLDPGRGSLRDVDEPSDLDIE